MSCWISFHLGWCLYLIRTQNLGILSVGESCTLNVKEAQVFVALVDVFYSALGVPMNLHNSKIKMLTSVFRSMWVFFIIRKKSEQNWSRQINGCHRCISLLFLLGKLDYFQLIAMNLLPGDSVSLSLFSDPFLSSMFAYMICISLQRIKL